MNLKGGYKILLLSTLSLVEVATAITDKKVIEQLSTLTGYMGKKELKPILIHCGIEKDSEVTKHCVMGELIKISDTEYVIIGKIDNAYLTISVEFTQDEETGEYYIASGDAKYIYSGTLTVSGLLVDGESAINGDLTVFGDIIGRQITGTEIIELMSGYSFSFGQRDGITNTPLYAGCVKTGNKLTISVFGKLNRSDEVSGGYATLGKFTIPKSIGDKIIPEALGSFSTNVSSKVVAVFNSPSSKIDLYCDTVKGQEDTEHDNLTTYAYNVNNLSINVDYQYRLEITFLLSENLVSE